MTTTKRGQKDPSGLLMGAGKPAPKSLPDRQQRPVAMPRRRPGRRLAARPEVKCVRSYLDVDGG
jgi:hypothetical protein